MRPVATGRPGTEVFPTGWQAAHAAAVEGAMAAATVEIRHPGVTTRWDEGTQSTVTTGLDPHYTGPARIQALTNDARRVDSAEDTVTVAGYLVAVPLEVAGVLPDDLVLVTVCDDDADLVDVTLQVEDVVRGTHRFERDLLCSISTQH